MTGKEKLTGTVFKRCSCTREVVMPDGSIQAKPWGTSCPQLTYKDGRWSKDHGRGQARAPARRVHHRGRVPRDP